MDIRSLKLFLHLCDTLHFGQTAQQMHVSPSTLSRQLQRLETLAECRLFERDNRQVRLTQGGVAFRRFAQETVNQWHFLQQQLTPTTQLSGQLRLYCSVTAAYSHLPQLLDKFRRQHPLVEIHLTTGDAANAPEQVQQNLADIAIAAKPEVLANSLDFKEIDSIPMCLVVAHHDPLPNHTITDWLALPLILPERGPSRHRAENLYRQLGLKMKIYAQVSGHEAMASMVALGCGISILPEVVIQHSPVRERLTALPLSMVRPLALGCISRRTMAQDPRLAAFYQSLS
ncbi:HTH-type transcriptional activator IlvY [Shewanella sp. NIFS-20-20]|uniref:HTH-type transcriptional activator IlvY n=1 Tax=Shewanella sp. NIFS-20-20 TaxID=2853806 RepID=UPI001C4604A5|nr:HTH-type transcriptional activator IlvY [Shewanella sp. NIFS-20-20]MBV7316787.1 HTH-type transcriptional activator IlvY [Shewanella sp. NIFS-20-20]